MNVIEFRGREIQGSRMTPQATGPLWTQDQAIAFESARECINELASIYTGYIEAERTVDSPDEKRIAGLRAFRSGLFRERDALRVNDDEAVAKVRSVYGAHVRELRAAAQQRRAA